VVSLRHGRPHARAAQAPARARRLQPGRLRLGSVDGRGEGRHAHPDLARVPQVAAHEGTAADAATAPTACRSTRPSAPRASRCSTAG
jgi:hypothetical protein